MDSLVEFFIAVDDFYKIFVTFWLKQILTSGEIQRQRKRSLNIVR
jgi:hypothetical protein